MVTRSESTEAELGSLIDSVNGLIVQLHQTLSIRGAGSTSDVNTDDAVSPGGGDTSSGVLLIVVPEVLRMVALPVVGEVLKWNKYL